MIGDDVKVVVLGVKGNQARRCHAPVLRSRVRPRPNFSIFDARPAQVLSAETTLGAG
jgi:hypothetical protein